MEKGLRVCDRELVLVEVTAGIAVVEIDNRWHEHQATEGKSTNDPGVESSDFEEVEEVVDQNEDVSD
jgi:hypothetical protein